MFLFERSTRVVKIDELVAGEGSGSSWARSPRTEDGVLQFKFPECLQIQHHTAFMETNEAIDTR